MIELPGTILSFSLNCPKMHVRVDKYYACACVRVRKGFVHVSELCGLVVPLLDLQLWIRPCTALLHVIVNRSAP